MRCLAVLALTGAFAHAEPNTALTDLDDRHIGTSYAITFAVAVVARNLEVPRWQAVLAGVATTIVLGTAKELRDPIYSWGDQSSNAIGMAAAATVVFTFEL